MLHARQKKHVRHVRSHWEILWKLHFKVHLSWAVCTGGSFKYVATCMATLLVGHTYSRLALSAASLWLTLQALGPSRTVFALQWSLGMGTRDFPCFWVFVWSLSHSSFFYFFYLFFPSLLPEQAVSSTLFMPDSSSASSSSSSSSSSAHVSMEMKDFGVGVTMETESV